MSNEYYGVASTPMDDYLAHYGVRGMKWGVRKAIHKGTDKAMEKAYKKASKKLKKLTAKADLQNQTNEYKYHTRKMFRNFAGGIGASLGSLGAAKLATTKGFHTVSGSGNHLKYTEFPGLTGTAKTAAVGTSVGLAALGAGLVGKEAYHAGKAIAAMYRTTTKGHAKAVAKRDAWKKEMKSAFKGTQYDASGSVKKKKKRVNV